MSLAIIKTGGKQYIVTPGQKLRIEKVNKKEGSEVSFNEVLLLSYSPSGSARLGDRNNKIEIGNPYLKGVKVLGKVLKQGKNKKVIVFKFVQTNRYHVKKGHRQLFTEVEITDIETKSKEEEK